MARINTDGEAEKLRELFAARMERLFCKSPRKQACRCLFKNPTSPASRTCPVLFLDANSWHFLDLEQGAKSRATRGASGRVGDVVSQSRASSLVKGFENATPAQNSERRLASLLHPCSSESSEVSHAFFKI